MNQSTQTMTRRQFLVVAGCGCAGLVIAGTGCARVGEATATAAAACPYGYRYDAYPGQCYRFIDSNGSGYCDFSEPVVTVVTVPTTAATTGAVPTAAATTTTQTNTAATTTEETRVILCDRGCSAPGQCGRFVDSDGTGVCDLSEGIVISVSAAATATPSATAAAATTAGSATSLATATPAATAAATSVALVVLCDRGCRYPGSCGRYTDNDGTGICDLSEGIPADQAAAYESAGGGRGRGGRGG